MQTNVLYYGDNLDILPYGPSGRRYIPDESIDLIYLDPPPLTLRPPTTSSSARSPAPSATLSPTAHPGSRPSKDTSHWGDPTAQAYDDVLRGPHQQVARMLKAMVDGLGHNQVTAYLAMIRVRLLELPGIRKIQIGGLW